MRKVKLIGMLVLICSLLFTSSSFVLAKDLTTKYRVYQYNRAIMEYADYQKALSLAKTLSYSRVEQIGTGEWLWNNYPKFVVYQYDVIVPNGLTDTLDQAKVEAQKWSHATIRPIEGAGWAWDNYPNYQVFQHHASLPNWKFRELKDATNEAKKWANAFVIDLKTGKSVWNNYTEKYIEDQRAKEPRFQVRIDGSSLSDWQYAFLGDAVEFANEHEHAEVYDMTNGNTMYSNIGEFKVYQNDRFIRAYYSVRDAITYANTLAHATIEYKDKEIWSNYKFYQVFVDGKRVGEFNQVEPALAEAKKHENAWIQTYTGHKLWDNMRKLQYWAWNGSSSSATIKSQVSQTQGLDVDSPTWFKLKSPDGTMEDTSNAETVQWLHSLGIEVHPLVHNDFSSTLTTQFLSNKAAQEKFITTLVDRLVKIGADGVNIDFESLAGSDRDRFTEFVKNLSHAAHQKGLTVSIDLPRGSLAWNHMTAFDHEKLAPLVDYMIIMAYDQHYSGSDTPGSVSGLQWMRKGIEEFLSYGIPREKIILGIPFYVREWRLDANGKMLGNRALVMGNIPALMAEKQTKSEWDATFQQFKITYQENGSTYVFWLEDETTVKARIQAAHDFELGGVAAWRLGHEYADIWPVMLQAK